MALSLGLMHASTLFAQPCNTPVALPYVQAFTGAAPGTLPNCITTANVSGTVGGEWTTGTLSGGYFTAPVAHVSTADAGPYDTWLFLPLMQFSASETYRLAYRYGTNSGSGGPNNQGRLSVWYGSSATPAAMTNAIVDHGTFSHAVAATHTDFSPNTSGNYYIGFRVNTAPFTWMVVLDDISFGLQPNCLEPSNVMANGPGFTDVQLTWTCAGCTGSYIVEYGPASGFTTPGSGTLPGPNGTIASTTASSPFMLDGLAMGESYRVFVRQNCPGGGAGGNSPAVVFSTLLGNPLCGNAAELVCDDVVQGATHQAFQLPDIGNYCGQGLYQTRGVWFTVEGNGGEYSVSSAPANGGWTIGGANMVLFTGDCGDQRCLALAPWTEAEQGSTITWVTDPGESYYLYVYGDGVSFQLATTCEEAPSCFPPSDISLSDVGTNSVRIAWTNSAAPQYGYEVRTSGVPGSGPVGLVTSGGGITAPPLNIPGLQPETEYVLYVRGECGGGDLSAWGAFGFGTLCAPTNVPYNGAFPGPGESSCYRVADVNGDGTWYGVPRPNGNYNDAYVAQYGVAPGAAIADDWLITRGVNTVAGSSYRITYKYSVISAVYPERLAVYYGNGATPGALTNLLANHAPATNNHLNVITNTVEISPGTGVLYVGFHTTSEGNGWQLCVGDVRIELVPTCLPPDGMQVSGLSQTGATIGWQAAAGAVGYTYEVRASGLPGSGPAGLAASGTTTTLSATIAGQLVNSTIYRVYVRTDCGSVNGWSEWSDAFVFNTLCPPATIPFSEDFSGIAQGEIPLCFTRVTPGQISPEGWGQWVGSSQISGPTYQLPVAEVVTVEDLQYDTWLYTQGLQLTGGVAYRLTYRYGTNSGSTGQDNQGRMTVWLGNSPEVPSMTRSIIDHGTFRGLVFDGLADFTPPTSGTWYIGYRVHSAPLSRRVVLDDIHVELAPTCMEPTDVLVLSGAESTVQVNWECDGCPGEFIVEYGPASVYTTPGTDGQPGAFGAISSSNATSPHFVTGLATGENYRFFVRQVCVGNDYSLPSAAVEATTPLANGFCGQALPLVCGGSALGATANAPEWPNIQDLCGFNPRQTTGVWYRITGDGGTYTVSSCPTDGGANISDLDLLVLSGTCNNFTCVARAEAGEAGCAGTRVEWETEAGVQYHIWVIGSEASFTLRTHCVAPPVCAAPTGLALTGLTTNSAQVNWTAVAGDAYDHEVRTSGTPGSGPTGLITSGNGLAGGPLNIPGLAPATEHVVYVRRNCSAEDVSSEWISVAFRTVCEATNIPYNGAFTTAAVPECFRVVDVAENGTWGSFLFNLGGYTDTYVARIGYQPGVAKEDWLITQGLNTVAGASYKLIYKRSVLSALYGERLAVYYGNAPVASAMTELLIDHGTVTNTVPQVQEIVFTPGEGPVYIAFRAYSLATGWQLFVGDIRVEQEAACGAPAAFAFITSPTSVQVDWSCPGCTGRYYVEYGATGFTPGTGATAGVGTLAGPFTGNGTLIEGLSGDLTQLHFVVRRDCSGDMFSTNSVPVSPVAAQLVDCSGRLNETWCYGNNEDSFHRYIGEGPIVLQFTGGTPQSCCDHLYVYDGPTASSPLLFTGNVLSGVEVGSSNAWNALTLRIVSDAGFSCADGSTGPLSWDVLCGGVGVDERVGAELLLYPNPTNGMLYINMPDQLHMSAMVQVLDLSGRKLLERQMPVGSGPQQMDVSALASGRYLMRLVMPDNSIVRPFQLLAH